MRNTKLRFSDAKGVNSKGTESATRRYKLKGLIHKKFSIRLYGKFGFLLNGYLYIDEIQNINDEFEYKSKTLSSY